MKLRRNKKGFTIVELVIVIAVIGVLAAILIPTFVNLTNKANRASDESLVKNLNTALAMQEQEPGDTKNNTMHDAVEDLKEYGYLLPNLVTKSEDKLLWNQKTNRFILEDGDKQDYKDIDFWRIQNSITGDEVYSVYAGLGFECESGVVDVKVGFDTGYCEDITEVNYVRSGQAQEVIIRTSEGTLNVNAPNDTVHHYSFLHELDIVAIATASYHEHGTVLGGAVIAQGHIVLEEGSNVPSVEVINATGDVIVTANEGTFINVDAGSADNASIVANSEDVYVSGVDAESISGTKADDVELPTVITSESQLASAIASGKVFMQLGADFDTTQAHVISSNALLDFAGHTINSSLMQEALFTNNAKLRIADSVQNGGIQSANNNIIMNNGVLSIDGGRFAGNREYTLDEAAAEGVETRGVIHNNPKAKAVINNIDLFTRTDFGVLNYGNFEINGGTFTSESEATGTRRYSYCVTNYDGEMIINYAVVNGVHGGIGFNGGKGTVNDAVVTLDKTKNSFYALYIAGEKGVVEATINGGIYNPGKGGNCLYVGNQHDGGLGKTAMATVTGGTFNGKIYAAFSASSNYGLGILKVTGGTFKFDPTSYLEAGYETSKNGDYWTVKKA